MAAPAAPRPSLANQFSADGKRGPVTRPVGPTPGWGCRGDRVTSGWSRLRDGGGSPAPPAPHPPPPALAGSRKQPRRKRERCKSKKVSRDPTAGPGGGLGAQEAPSPSRARFSPGARHRVAGGTCRADARPRPGSELRSAAREPRPLPRHGLSPHPFLPQGAVATGEDPTSVAIASIQSAATFPDPNIKYVFRTENGGTQVRRPSGWVPSGQDAEGPERGSALPERPPARSQPEGEREGVGRGLMLRWAGPDAGVGRGRAEPPPRRPSLQPWLSQQVMYRVIQVADGQLDGQTEGTSAISGYPAAQSMTQAVIQGAFTSEDAVETEATATETHYTYFPTTAVADTSTSAGAGTTATAVVTTQNSEALLGQPTPTGQFFVMMSPQEVLQGGAQRSITPRAHPYSPKSEAPRATRDEKRRAQHNEVERRRRDKINNWIVQLSKIIPDCSMENTKSGQSKGGILSKACDYIQELRQSNHRLSEELQGLDQLQMDNEVLRQQVEDLKNKNLILRAQLRQHGVEIVIKNDSH
ncbi:hypothetical protein QYF61_015953 [Mycteria americana]|uniref:Upstream stimulatory factor 1 n=17 Tax=Neoaves TaxID=3078114 RepID=A0AAN7N2P6_MYCAM|nr:hypothetical protein QYF61_015953 [Mycteria americana]